MLLGSWLAQDVICLDYRNGTGLLVRGKTITGRGIFDHKCIVATDILNRLMHGIAVGIKKCGTNTAVIFGIKQQPEEMDSFATDQFKEIDNNGNGQHFRPPFSTCWLNWAAKKHFDPSCDMEGLSP